MKRFAILALTAITMFSMSTFAAPSNPDDKPKQDDHKKKGEKKKQDPPPPAR